jgi:NTE family protein
VDFLCINPFIEINDMVSRHFGSLPRAMRRILKMTGATPSGGAVSGRPRAVGIALPKLSLIK